MSLFDEALKMDLTEKEPEDERYLKVKEYKERMEKAIVEALPEFCKYCFSTPSYRSPFNDMNVYEYVKTGFRKREKVLKYVYICSVSETYGKGRRRFGVDFHKDMLLTDGESLYTADIINRSHTNFKRFDTDKFVEYVFYTYPFFININSSWTIGIIGLLAAFYSKDSRSKSLVDKYMEKYLETPPEERVKEFYAVFVENRYDYSRMMRLYDYY